MKKMIMIITSMLMLMIMMVVVICGDGSCNGADVGQGHFNE